MKLKYFNLDFRQMVNDLRCEKYLNFSYKINTCKALNVFKLAN